MAIAFDAVSSGKFADGAPGTVLTVSHTAAGSNRVALIAVAMPGNATLVSLTYGGVNATLIASVLDEYFGSSRTYFYGFDSPPITPTDVVATFSSSTELVAVTVLSFTGATLAGITSGTAGSATNSSANATPSVGVASAVDELVVGSLSHSDKQGACVSSGGQTSRASLGYYYEIRHAAVDEKPGAAGTVTVGWTMGATTGAWSAAAVSLKPSDTVVGTTYTYEVEYEKAGQKAPKSNSRSVVV